MDARKNFAYGTVATPPSPATSGASMTLDAGHGARFPITSDGAYNIVVWPAGTLPLASNAEIIRVAARSTDVLSSMTRTQESSSARSIIAGDQVALCPTDKVFDDLEALIAACATLASNTFVGSQTIERAYLILDWANDGSAALRNPSASPTIIFNGVNGWWGNGMDTANPTYNRDMVFAARGRDFNITDGATHGNANLTSPAEGNFTNNIVGYTVTGPGIPGGTTVLSVASRTSLTMSASASGSLSGQTVKFLNPLGPSALDDFAYINHGGGGVPTFGIGATPPPNDYRATIRTAGTIDPTLGGLCIGAETGTTGHFLLCGGLPGGVHGTGLFWIDKNGVMNGVANGFGSLTMRADATFGYGLILTSNNDTRQFTWGFSGANLVLRDINNSADLAYFTNGLTWLTGDLNVVGKLKLTNSSHEVLTGAPLTVTGSKASGAAFVSLLARLVSLGLIVDSTTA